jgi:hypothetical protein
VHSATTEPCDGACSGAVKAKPLQKQQHNPVARYFGGDLMGANQRTFRKGHKKAGGRQRGSKNRVPIALRDAIIAAAEQVGNNLIDKDGNFKRDGDGGLLGFCVHLARHHKHLFAPLLGKVLPMHTPAAVAENRVYRTEEEVRALCAERGIPFESLLDLRVEVPIDMVDITPEEEARNADQDQPA